MNRAASVFPVDHYASTPQTADITHDHLANPGMSHCLTPSQFCLPMSKPLLPCQKPVLAASLPVIYLQEQHSSGAGLDQMAVISQAEAQRWEA